jgi:hypothetical protein
MPVRFSSAQRLRASTSSERPHDLLTTAKEIFPGGDFRGEQGVEELKSPTIIGAYHSPVLAAPRSNGSASTSGVNVSSVDHAIRENDFDELTLSA